MLFKFKDTEFEGSIKEGGSLKVLIGSNQLQLHKKNFDNSQKNRTEYLLTEGATKNFFQKSVTVCRLCGKVTHYPKLVRTNCWLTTEDN